MDLEGLRAFAASLDAQYRAAGEDPAVFPALAEAALAALPPFDALPLAPWIAAVPSLAPKRAPAQWFGDLPLTLFRTESWFLELLTWTSSTTAIHGHAFCGAFRVARGSSLHTTYALHLDEPIDDGLAYGRATLLGVERLLPGDVRPIPGGPEGPAHALFHLEQPSMTLVARTHGEAWQSPQRHYDRPGVISCGEAQPGKARLDLLVRAYEVARAAEDDASVTAWFEALASLPLGSDFRLTRRLRQRLDDAGNLAQAIEAVRSAHGTGAAEALAAVLARDRILADITIARASITDPSDRLFLALLANVPTAEAMRRVLASTHPGEDPDALLATSLARLADPDRFMATVTGTFQGNAAPSPLITRLVRGGTGLDAAGRSEVAAHVVRGRADAPAEGPAGAAFEAWSAEPALEVFRLQEGVALW